jgi:hypothetical protein
MFMLCVLYSKDKRQKPGQSGHWNKYIQRQRTKKSRWGRDFPHPFRPALGSTEPPIKWVPALIRGGKAVGARRSPPTSISTEVKERVELYLYFPSGPSWLVLRGTLPLPRNVLATSNKLDMTACSLVDGYHRWILFLSWGNVQVFLDSRKTTVTFMKIFCRLNCGVDCCHSVQRRLAFSSSFKNIYRTVYV